MSVKDVREYYDKISEDYHELVLTLKELEEEYNELENVLSLVKEEDTGMDIF